MKLHEVILKVLEGKGLMNESYGYPTSITPEGLEQLAKEVALEIREWEADKKPSRQEEMLHFARLKAYLG